MSELGDLIERLQDGDDEVVRELAAHGDAAVEALGDDLDEGSVGPVSAATFLRMAASAGAVEALARRALDGELDDRAAAIAALGHGRSPEAVAPLVACLDARPLFVDAVTALGWHGGDAARDALRTAWAERVGDDYAAALEREATSGRARTLQAWAELGAALGRLGDPTGAGLIEALIAYGRDTEIARAWAVRVTAVGAAAWLPSPTMATALVEALADDEAEVAETAVRSLASIGTAACVPALVHRFELDRRVGEAIELALYELFGDAAPPQGQTPTGLRRWWMRASAAQSAAEVQWMGAPADAGRAIEDLDADPDGGLARVALSLWTGIDFGDDEQLDAPGDATDAARAADWWREHGADWTIGALYRGGRALDLAPIVTALASSAA